MRAEIFAYYRRGGETARLTDGAGRLEFLRTWDVLGRVLPAPPARVLDVGGATGVYAAPLTDVGYTVRVVDAVAEHVAAAAEWPGVTAEVGDARALPADAASVDAVLLFGPLYHLLDRADRIRAWREAARVVRPGGVVVAATITRFASLLDGFVKGYLAEPEFGPVVDRVLATGEHRPPEGRWFTTAYFHHPDELPGEVAEADLELDRIVSVEGPLGLVRGLVGDPDWEPEVLARLRQVETEPSLYGASGHLLTVARRSTE
ncbi:class I SAM-dependent methyltransferase [Planosporangium thailandense]|uniref:Class I SAM-dependent methyltransferase n=1 Tax=Planosporangium thailandense TaxID=765197 RepID=A0ABX0XWN7_9ACTN|nr:class I SAM-dependent methyltransferase [Planosporangium thailandense]NJC70456.1 class I SAM-dependent methyltransferase [Planosporangium thailandense]